MEAPLALRSTACKKSLLKMSPIEVRDLMRANGQHRGYMIWDRVARRVRVSHPMFDEMAAFWATEGNDYRQHEGVFWEIGERTGYLHSASVLKTVRGAAAGGVRLLSYSTFEAYTRDGLRLALGMGRKNAAAGIWWGGGKGVIAALDPAQIRDRHFRDVLFQEYGVFMSSLNGCYITAEDLGVRTIDCDQIFRTTRYLTCVSERFGGSGNPGQKTGWGLICGFEAALDHLGIAGGVTGKRIAVMGAGNVCTHLLEKLVPLNPARVVIADINAEAVAALKRKYTGVGFLEFRVAKPGDMSILYEDVDIVSPCAVGGILNPETIPNIRAKIVCGSANNQLRNDRTDDKLMRVRGILFVVDFVVNRMGIVNCADEQYGRLENDPAIMRHFDKSYADGIYQVTRRVCALADRRGITEVEAAAELADKAAEIPHPIWGHRGQAIIDELVAAHWETKPRYPLPIDCAKL